MVRILFLGDGYPVETNAGSILYLRLMDTYGVENFCYYGIGYKAKKQLPEEFYGLPKKQSSLRIWGNSGRVARYLKKIPWIEELFYFLLIPIISRKIRKFAAENQVDLVIAVLRADVLAIINKLNKHKKHPLLGFISDTVEAEFTDKHRIYRYKMQEYLKAISNAVGIYVAGETMNDYIKENFKKPTSIIRLGYEPNFNKHRNIYNKINVFFAGSVYAKKEFESFVNALNILANKYNDYIITFTIATKYRLKTDSDSIKIKNLGWVDEQELIRVMQDAHIGYVPYKFDKRYSTQMKYAFPNKAGFYLSSGLPIFFHGPQYSSMSQFFEKYECGIHCASLKKDDIISHLEKILFDKTFYNKCLVNAKIAYNNEFTIDVMKNNFKRFIDFALNSGEKN